MANDDILSGLIEMEIKSIVCCFYFSCNLYCLPVICCCAQSCMHLVFLRVLKMQRYHHAMVKYHCIHWYRMHVIPIHLFCRYETPTNCQANHMCLGTWHY